MLRATYGVVLLLIQWHDLWIHGYLLALADFALKLLEQLLFLALKCVVVLLKVYNLSTL